MSSRTDLLNTFRKAAGRSAGPREWDSSAGADFQSVFDFAPQQVLSWLAQGFSDSKPMRLIAWLASESPSRLTHPYLDIFAIRRRTRGLPLSGGCR